MCAGEAGVVVAHGQACCVSSDGDSETGRRGPAQQAHAPRLLRRTQTSTERGFATAYGMFSWVVPTNVVMRLCRLGCGGRSRKFVVCKPCRWEQRAAGVCRRGASFEFCYLSPEAFRLSAERAVETPFLVQGAPSLRDYHQGQGCSMRHICITDRMGYPPSVA